MRTPLLATMSLGTITLHCFLALAALRDSPTGAPELRNCSFEGSLDDWTTHIYGAQPRIEFDEQVRRQGKYSLRISATEPSDAALSQEILLQGGRWYRFTGWVRTRGLEPRGAKVLGTFQIQLPGGKGILASGPNSSGDTEWNEVAIVFQAPSSGLTRFSVFFAGFGKGVGTAWFDDLKLEEINLATIPMAITREFLVDAEISPLQYGQFIEYLCDLVPGMWAEQLDDGSFEGLTPYKFAFVRERDFRQRPWYPSGAVNRADYVRDPADPVSGRVSQKIVVPDGPPCTVGIAQDGVFVGKDKPCVFSCYLRQEGLAKPVRMRIHREGDCLATCEFQPAKEWRKYTARLIPNRTENHATVTIDFCGPGTLWLDNASLMPENNIGGWRPDVVAAVKALKPGVIRFGGSALDDRNLGDFEWRDTIGDPDRRKPFRAWGGLQPTGAGLEEIVQFCRAVRAEPLICVRVTQRTPQNAAEEVEYFNGPATSPMGRLRADNGHAEPYRIRYWQIGNEQGGAAYESRLADFAKAMKKVDPAIELFASYPSQGVLEQAGDLIDYVCPHHYDVANLAAAEQNILDVQALYRRAAPNRKIRIGVTEWNTTGGDWGTRRARLWTLENALACARYHNLLHRHANAVTIANRSNLTNSFCSGIVQTDNHRMYLTPTYYAQKLYATLAGARPLRIESRVRPSAAPDCSATLSADGKTIALFAVNPIPQEIVRPVDLTAFTDAAKDIEVWTLADRRHAGEPDAANSFAEPERIAAERSAYHAPSGRFDFRFAPLSLTVLIVKLP
jgi:alpha-N-arabinofuranosidase